jgi:hypothetical protein
VARVGVLYETARHCGRCVGTDGKEREEEGEKGNESKGGGFEEHRVRRWARFANVVRKKM